jgi:hypothetical protein
MSRLGERGNKKKKDAKKARSGQWRQEGTSQDRTGEEKKDMKVRNQRDAS